MNSKTIAIVNYGLGNIGSVANALEYLGVRYFISEKRTELTGADAYILPGVGAFAVAMENLKNLDLVDELTKQVMKRKKPYLGICLGLQLLAEDSVELGYAKGLGWIKGNVLEIDPASGIRVPHVGWNNINTTDKHFLFERIDDEGHFYFDHSFHLQCDRSIVIANCDYGTPFVAAIHSDNIIATQFHPEKSQRNGLKLLRNYLNFVKSYG